MKSLFILTLSCIFAVNAATAQVPDTEIFLIDISSHGDHLHVGQPENITNRPGYDNQPYFLPDGSGILFSSIEEERKADIFKFNFSGRSIINITNTPEESEFSPMLTPDNKFISVVQVESDDSTQRIWKFPINGGEPQLVFKNNKKVGYYTWQNENEIYAFVLGEPFTLQHLNIKKGSNIIIANNIGRSVQKIPGEDAISFVAKDSENWTVNKVDSKGSISKIIHTFEGEEDYAWMSDGTLLMGNKGKLYKYKPGVDNDWKEIADFTDTPAKNFYRIATSSDGSKIALVAYKGEKP